MIDKLSLIEGNGLTVQFGRNIVLDRVNIIVTENQVVTLIGPNGAGKTTLIRVLLGLETVSSGMVCRRPGLRVGYVPQRLYVDPTLPLTVRRFLSLVRGGREKVHQVLAEVAASHLVDAPLQRISGGEMQRVLLARALLGKPDLLVLDEPAQGIDVRGRSDLYALISQLSDQYGCGVLMVSHDLHLVMAATDHVICLNRHVCCAGTPSLVSQHPEYMALFGETDIVQTLAVYRHRHDHRHDLNGEVRVVVAEGKISPPAQCCLD